MSESQQSQPNAEKWRYTHVETPKPQGVSLKGVAELLFTHCLFYVFSVLCSLGILIALYWACEKVFASTLFDEPWMQPSVLIVSAYFSGVCIRMGTEQLIRSMGVYFIVLLGFASFTGLCWLDIQQTGSLFSTRFLPETLHLSSIPFIFAVPIVGLFGMLCYRWFTLR